MAEIKRDGVMEKLFEAAHARFAAPEGEPFKSLGFNKNRELVECGMLIEAMEQCGALDEDLQDVLMYIAVVTDAQKHNLDWIRAYTELGIDEKVEKYIEAYVDDEECVDDEVDGE